MKTIVGIMCEEHADLSVLCEGYVNIMKREDPEIMRLLIEN